MKVYVITECYENVIRLATLDKQLAEKICGALEHHDLKINEVELLESNINPQHTFKVETSLL